MDHDRLFKEGVMEIMNPLVEFGRTQGQIDVLLRQLRRRFGELPTDLPDRLDHLTESQLHDFAEALLDFQTLADAQAWLARV